METTLVKTRKPRTITLDSLIAQLEKQPLEAKIKIQSAVKASIENDKKKLQEQLALITDVK